MAAGAAKVRLLDNAVTRASSPCIATEASVSSIETSAECLAFRRARPSPFCRRQTFGL